MKKIKEFVKQYMIGLILSFLVCVVTVSAITYFPSNQTTYDNSNTGMSSTNVQDAVDELYNVCVPPIPLGDQILEKVSTVITGNGLYEDIWESGRYFYKGINVNNYIKFNNEAWRIVSIEPDKTVKIMRDAVLPNRNWDSSGSYGNNNWARPATLNTYLNGSYLTGTLNATAQSQIVVKDWSIGAVTADNNDLKEQINEESSNKWNGKVALITLSEYLRSNSNQSSCGTHSKSQDNYSSCKNTTWMYNDETWFTLSPRDDSVSVYRVNSNGRTNSNWANISNFIRPSVYLSSELQIVSGDGSRNNPFQIEL